MGSSEWSSEMMCSLQSSCAHVSWKGAGGDGGGGVGLEGGGGGRTGRKYAFSGGLGKESMCGLFFLPPLFLAPALLSEVCCRTGANNRVARGKGPPEGGRGGLFCISPASLCLRWHLYLPERAAKPFPHTLHLSVGLASGGISKECTVRR